MSLSPGDNKEAKLTGLPNFGRGLCVEERVKGDRQTVEVDGQVPAFA